MKRMSILRRTLAFGSISIALLCSCAPTEVSGSARLPGTSADSTQGAVAYDTVEIDGVEIFYREAGPKDAPTLFLLHG